MRERALIRSWGRFVVTILLLAALAPTLARSARFAVDGPWPPGPICVTPGNDGPAGDAALHPDCPLCLLQGQGTLEPPATLDPASRLPAFGAAVPWTPAALPRTHTPRLTAQPRAPPLLP